MKNQKSVLWSATQRAENRRPGGGGGAGGPATPARSKAQHSEVKQRLAATETLTRAMQEPGGLAGFVCLPVRGIFLSRTSAYNCLSTEVFFGDRMMMAFHVPPLRGYSFIAAAFLPAGTASDPPCQTGFENISYSGSCSNVL